MTDDGATLAEKVQALHEDLEEAEDVDEKAVEEAGRAAEDLFKTPRPFRKPTCRFRK